MNGYTLTAVFVPLWMAMLLVFVVVLPGQGVFLFTFMHT